MSSLQIIYSSTSGHTEYVINTLLAAVQEQASTMHVETCRAELAQPEDLLKGDVLLLASGTWNTGSIEGQLNPHMQALLKDRAATIDLQQKKVLLIALGDERYHFTAGAMTHLMEFVQSHNGNIIEPTLKIINEPYGQEKNVQQWFDSIHSHLSLKST